MHLYDDRPGTSTVEKILIRLEPKLLLGRTTSYLERLIELHRGERFDDILIIKGESFTVPLMKRLLDSFPSARKRFYLWDSFRNASGAREKLPLFERCFTFDRFDAEATPGLIFRPMFFPREYLDMPPLMMKPGDPIQVLFIGTVHTDRYRVLRRLERALPPSATLNSYLYFPSRLLYVARRIFDPSFWTSSASHFQFEPVGRLDYWRAFRAAHVIVEIERPVQTGLTIRALEALAAGKKLVTTNPAIADYDFYDPANIAIIDRDRPRLSEAFVRDPYRRIADEIVERYSLDRWIGDVFSD